MIIKNNYDGADDSVRAYMECLLYAQHFAKHFMPRVLLNPHKNPVGLALSLSPFCR